MAIVRRVRRYISIAYFRQIRISPTTNGSSNGQWTLPASGEQQAG